MRRSLNKNRKGGAINSSTGMSVENESNISAAVCSGAPYIRAVPRPVNIESTDTSQSKAATKKENKKKEEHETGEEQRDKVVKYLA